MANTVTGEASVMPDLENKGMFLCELQVRLRRWDPQLRLLLVLRRQPAQEALRKQGFL